MELDTQIPAAPAATELAVDEVAQTNPYKTIGDRLSEYNVTTSNAMDLEIAPFLAKFKYDGKKMQYAQKLIEEARAADALNQKEYSEQYAAKARLEKEFGEATRPYKISLGVARVAFKKDPEACKALVLKGPRKKAIGDWVRDTDIFYRNILSTPLLLRGMDAFGRSEEILKSEYKEIRDVSEALASYRKESGEALKSTESRNTKMEELDDWMADFIAIARIALQDNSTLLKKMGL